MDGLSFSAVEIPFIEPSEILADPHGAFRALRQRTPVIRIDTNTYSVLRAEDVMALMKDPRAMQIDGRSYVAMAGVPAGVTSRFLSDVMVLSNDPEHRRRRGPFAKTFAHGAMRRIRDSVRQVADSVLADIPRGTAFDFVDVVAGRLPSEMIASILGLPTDDAAQFSRWVGGLALALSPVYPQDRHAEIEAAASSLLDYVTRALEERRAVPRDDVLSQLVAAAETEDGLTLEDLAIQVMGVILGGSDTTRAAFAITVALLLQHPEQWAAVKADPALIPGAVAEGIRCEPAVGNLPRYIPDAMEISGAWVPGGSMLALSTLSAMRDPALYTDPDRFDIARTDHPRMHLAFGGGAHRCLGEMLARIEMEEALTALIAVAPDIELLDAPHMLGFGGIRHISAMPVRVG